MSEKHTSLSNVPIEKVTAAERNLLMAVESSGAQPTDTADDRPRRKV